MGQRKVGYYCSILLVHLGQVAMLHVLGFSFLHFVEEEVVDLHVLVLVEVVLRLVLLFGIQVAQGLHNRLPAGLWSLGWRSLSHKLLKERLALYLMHVHLVQGLVLVRVQEIKERTHLALFVMISQILHKGLVADVARVHLLWQLRLRADWLLEALLQGSTLFETRLPLP